MVAIKINYCSLVYNMRFREKNFYSTSGANNLFKMYFPTTSLLPQTYDFSAIGQGSTKKINTINESKIYPYPIKAWFELHLNLWNYMYMEVGPFFRLSILNSDETVNGTPEFFKGYSYEGYVKSFIIPANKLVLAEINTGLDKFGNGIGCSYKMFYKLDEAAPNAPVLQVSGVGSDNIKQIGDTIFSKSNDLTLNWVFPADNATVYNGYTYGPGGVTCYALEVYQNNILQNTINIDNNPVGNTYQLNLAYSSLPYNIKMKAYDFDGNVSPYSAALTVMVDQTVPAVTFPANATQYNNGNLTIAWNAVSDPAGIKEYEVALTNSYQQPGDADIRLSTVELNTTLNNVPSNKAYVWIRAIDNMNNYSAWSTQMRINSIDAISEAINGTPKYQVIINAVLVNEISGYKYYRKNNDGSVICLTPNQINTLSYVDQTILKHGQYEYGYSTFNALGQESAIKWADAQTIVIPDQIAPKVLVPNISPNSAPIVAPPTMVITSKVTFRLNEAKDIENDQLEYKLYLKDSTGTGLCKRTGLQWPTTKK